MKKHPNHHGHGRHGRDCDERRDAEDHHDGRGDHPLKLQVLLGTRGIDTLTGTAANERFNGLGGNDSLTGNDGEDHLEGGSGADTMAGGKGSDTYAFELADFAVAADRDTIIEAPGAAAGELDTLDYSAFPVATQADLGVQLVQFFKQLVFVPSRRGRDGLVRAGEHPADGGQPQLDPEAPQREHRLEAFGVCGLAWHERQLGVEKRVLFQIAARPGGRPDSCFFRTLKKNPVARATGFGCFQVQGINVGARLAPRQSVLFSEIRAACAAGIRSASRSSFSASSA